MELQGDLFQKVKLFNQYAIEINSCNLLALSQIYVFELSLKRLEAKDRITRLKKFSLENYAKAVLSLFAKNRPKHNPEVNSLFVNDIYNASMVNNMRAVEHVFQNPFIEVITDKRLACNQSKYLYRYFSPVGFLRELYRARRAIRHQNAAVDSICSQFGIPKRLLVLNLIDSVFILNCVENFLLAHQGLEHIILNTDAHKISKAFVFLARARGIKTYVLQHGSTVLEYGYLPVHADFMMAWGELSKQWFVDRGTPSDKVVALGTPKMDGLMNYKPIGIKSRDRKKVLVILNPIGDANVRLFLETVRDARLHLSHTLQVKLHPGSVDNREIVETVFDTDEISLFKTEDTHTLIQQSDVVITTTSTVGNEAIAYSRPLVQFVVPGLSVSMEYEKFGCSHLVRNAAELQSLISDTHKLTSKTNTYPEFLKAYFYSLDGKSALRIRDFILGNLFTG